MVVPGIRSNDSYHAITHKVTKTTERTATSAAVARYEAWTKVAEAAKESQDTELLEKIGSAPPTAVLGETIEDSIKSGGRAIFWSSLKPVGETTLETIDEYDEGRTHVTIQRQVGEFEGQGNFNLDFLVYSWLGLDLSQASKATIETLRLPPRVLTPFLILIVLSYLTPRNSKLTLDRYYAKMMTPVDADPRADEAKLETAYRDPSALETKRMFPGTDWQFLKPSSWDIVGFAISVAVCGLVIGLLIFAASIGG